MGWKEGSVERNLSLLLSRVWWVGRLKKRKWDTQRAAVGFALAFCGAPLLSGEALQRKAQESECVTLKRLGFTTVKPVLFLLLCPRREGILLSQLLIYRMASLRDALWSAWAGKKGVLRGI